VSAPSFAPTGIKAIDLLCPLPRGGTFEIIGPAGCGQLVFLRELIVRWGRTMDALAVVAGIDGADERVHLTRAFAQPDHTDLHGRVTLLFDLDEATRRARRLCAEGHHTLLACDVGLLGSDPHARERLLALAADGAGSLTVAVVAPHAKGERPHGPSADVDAVVAFHEGLARAGLYPAVSPLSSRSRLDVEAAMPGHAAVRRTLHDAWHLVKTLESYMTQPLYETERAFGRPGEWVEPRVALDDARRIVADHATMAPSDLLNRGRLP
jgi:F0F1-type ATP synthase beta subunit